MARLLASALLAVLLSGSVFGTEITTRENYLACGREDHLEDILRFVETRDAGNVRMYFATRKCDLLKDGLRATISRSVGNTVAIEINGTEIWTVSEALAFSQ